MSDTATTLRAPSEDCTATNEPWESQCGQFQTSACKDSSSPDTNCVRELAMQLPKETGENRARLRCALISAITRPSLLGEPISAYLEAVLAGLLASKQPGRLDEAIDILAQAGSEVECFAIDAARFNPPDQSDPDFWFVLIQAVDRITDGDRPHSLVEYALQSGVRQLMEGAIVALGQRTDNASRARLRELATEHESAFIRELAVEVLDDCEH